MYVGVVSTILGQGLLLGEVRVVVYGLACWLATSLFVMAYEEPTLRRSFGVEYEEFYKHVPRWIPRFKPWSANS